MSEFLYNWHSQFMNVERVPEILAAMLLCIIIGMITGPLAGNANPFAWAVFSGFFGKLGDRLDKKTRPKADLLFRGFLITALAITLAMFMGKGCALLVALYPHYSVVNTLLLSLTFTAGTIWFALLKLYFAMDQDKTGKGAYFALARTARRNLNAGDDFGIIRTALSLSARSFDKGMVAPALWYIIGGFPLVYVYCALAALSWRFGKDGFNSGFAGVAMALERLMGLVPSLISAMLITMAASLTPTAKVLKGIGAWMGAKGRAPYEQGGVPLSALSWALNVSLGGASQDISGSAIKADWVGPDGASAKLDHKHLRRGIYINVVAHILFVAALLGAYIWGSVIFS